MAQRLGIAAALLGDPGVLLLDEPVNGLDPEGIRWIRGLLRSLAAEGRAVLVSSHLISEIALMADHLVVIGRGRLLGPAPPARPVPVPSRGPDGMGQAGQPALHLVDFGITIAAAAGPLPGRKPYAAWRSTGRLLQARFRWLVRLVAVSAMVLIPWATYLADTHPSSVSARHWPLAWTGLDIALAADLGATGWLAIGATGGLRSPPCRRPPCWRLTPGPECARQPPGACWPWRSLTCASRGKHQKKLHSRTNT